MQSLIVSPTQVKVLQICLPWPAHKEDHKAGTDLLSAKVYNVYQYGLLELHKLGM